jgi:hypothetical protein
MIRRHPHIFEDASLRASFMDGGAGGGADDRIFTVGQRR